VLQLQLRVRCVTCIAGQLRHRRRIVEDLRTVSAMKKPADRKYAGYAIKFNDSSSVCSGGLAESGKGWRRQVVSKVARIRSDRVFSLSRNSKWKSINPTLTSCETAHSKINFVPRLNSRTFRAASGFGRCANCNSRKRRHVEKPRSKSPASTVYRYMQFYRGCRRRRRSEMKTLHLSRSLSCTMHNLMHLPRFVPTEYSDRSDFSLTWFSIKKLAQLRYSRKYFHKYLREQTREDRIVESFVTTR